MLCDVCVNISDGIGFIISSASVIIGVGVSHGRRIRVHALVLMYHSDCCYNHLLTCY